MLQNLNSIQKILSTSFESLNKLWTTSLSLCSVKGPLISIGHEQLEKVSVFEVINGPEAGLLVQAISSFRAKLRCPINNRRLLASITLHAEGTSQLWLLCDKL